MTNKIIIMNNTTTNSKIINAKPGEIYKAFASVEALEAWQAPGDMTAKIHNFDFRAGGGYEMSLYYPDDETDKSSEMKGKTKEKEDRFTTRFIELIPDKKIIEAVNFQTSDPDFMGEMLIEITFEPVEEGTNVTFLFKNIPKGIKPEDNEAGTISSLNKLTEYVTKL